MANNVIDVYDSKQAAQEIGMTHTALHMWLSRNPDYRPKRRFSGDDMLWTAEDIERVREARERTKKHGNRYKNKE